MKHLIVAAWPIRASVPAFKAPPLDKLAATCAIVMLAAIAATPIFEQVVESERAGAQTRAPAGATEPTAMTAGKETIVSGYVSQPFYLRADLKLDRPDGTDMTL